MNKNYKALISLMLILSFVTWFSVPHLKSQSDLTKVSSCLMIDKKSSSQPIVNSELQFLVGSEANAAQCAFLTGACAVATVGSLFGGLLGALVFGPTTIACMLDDIFDFSGC